MHLDLGSGLHCAPVYSVKGFTEPSVYDDAISLWLLNEASGTRADSIGSNDLTDNNTVLYRNLGPAGTVAAFAEGANEYLSIASGWTHGTSYMYTGWVKNPSPANFDSVITTNLANFNANVMIALYVSGGILRAVQADETGANPVTIDSLVSLSDGGWHFFAVWFDDADKKLRLSVDLETAVASAAMTGNYKTYPGASNLYIGSATGTTDAWDGNIARVGYYSTAGSDAIRTSLYNSGKGKAYADLTTAEKVGLVSYWNLDEASGNRADSHGSNTLTDNNTVGSATNSYPANLPGRVASFVAANNESLTGTALAELTDDFTVAFWINPANSTRWGIWNNGLNASPYGFTAEINIFGAGDLLVFATSDGSEYVYTNTGLLTVDGSAWNHVVIVYNTSESAAADKCKVFINGVSATMNAGATGTPVAHTVGNAFGLGVRATDRFYDGLMSSVAYWDGVKDQDFVDALYNSGAGAPLP